MPKKPSLRYHKRTINRYSAGMQKIDAQQTEEALSDLLYTQLFYYSLFTLSVFSFHNASCEFEGMLQEWQTLPGQQLPTQAHLPMGQGL